MLSAIPYLNIYDGKDLIQHDTPNLVGYVCL